MASLINSLQQLGSTYTVFEKDQLLTAPDLNSGISYLDGQERLTRAELIGVGIIAGLRVTSTASTITVRKGLGITTDGDLLTVGADTTYSSFKTYPLSAPDYAPLGIGAAMMQAWELVPPGVSDPDAIPLAQFQATTSLPLGNLVALLLASTFDDDQDDCVGTDCDNLGQLAVHDQKVLLVQKVTVAPLKEAIATPDAAAQALDDVVADRPVLAGVVTTSQLFKAYQTACTAILGKLTTALPKIYPACQSFISDIYPGDPSGVWLSKLSQALIQFGAVANVQYVYDLFKDFVETYQAFREQLFGDTTTVLPPAGAFAKHLLLGDVVPAADPNENRTGRYPSPAVAVRTLDHARFLAAKLQVLVDTFLVPGAATSIRITPSLGEDRSLEERAIPFYYNPKTNPAISDSWSFALARRGMGAFNYSYNADQYGGRGGAASPLTSQIGRFSFFRIEGHIGAPVSTAIAFLQGEAKNKNLPFSVHAVLVETDKTKIVRWFPPLYSDLNRVHRVFRYGLADQLYNASNYADTLIGQVNAFTTDAPTKSSAVSLHDNIKTNTVKAAGKLQMDYVTLQNDASWRLDVQTAQSSTAQLKRTLTAQAKTEFTTPFDSLIGSLPPQYLAWMDQFIQGKQDKDDEQHLISTFLGQHPGLEHEGGVPRGGTFVLAYDTAGVVVGDFMLHHRHVGHPDVEVEQPPVAIGPLIPTWPNYVFQNGITFNPPLDDFVGGKILKFWNETSTPAIDARFQSQKDFVSIFTGLIPKLQAGEAQGAQPSQPGVVNAGFADKYLNLVYQEMILANAKLDFVRSSFLDASRTQAGASATLKAQLTAAEKDVAASVTNVTTYVKTSNQNLASGSDGFTVMQAAATSAQRVNNSSVKSTLTRSLNKIKSGAPPELSSMIGSMATR